jgi:hypothetical protein
MGFIILWFCESVDQGWLPYFVVPCNVRPWVLGNVNLPWMGKVTMFTRLFVLAEPLQAESSQVYFMSSSRLCRPSCNLYSRTFLLVSSLTGHQSFDVIWYPHKYKSIYICHKSNFSLIHNIYKILSRITTQRLMVIVKVSHHGRLWRCPNGLRAAPTIDF